MTRIWLCLRCGWRDVTQEAHLKSSCDYTLVIRYIDDNGKITGGGRQYDLIDGFVGRARR